MVNRDTLTGELQLNYSEKLTFGKYNGKTIPTVLVIDPGYLKWMMTTDGRYKISDTWQYYLDKYAFDDNRKTYTTYMR